MGRDFRSAAAVCIAIPLGMFGCGDTSPTGQSADAAPTGPVADASVVQQPDAAPQPPPPPAPFFVLQWADVQIGSGSFAEPAFQFVLDEARPAFGDDMLIVIAGDLVENTDDTSLWVTYRDLIDGAGLTAERYIEVPGNHDALTEDLVKLAQIQLGLGGDLLSDYKKYTLAGRAGRGTYGIYDFETPNRHVRIVGVNTSAAGDPARDGAGYVQGSEIQDLIAQIDADPRVPDATLLLGHHPADLPDSLSIFNTDDEFMELVDRTDATAYLFGHHHFYMTYWNGNTLMSQASTIGNPADNQIADKPGFSLFALDDHGPIIKNVPILGAVGVNFINWPVVMITYPANPAMAQDLDPTAVNPWAKPLPRNSTSSVRVGVFSANTIDSVVVSVDGGPDIAMTHKGQYYEATITTPDAESCEIVVTAQSMGQENTDGYVVELE